MLRRASADQGPNHAAETDPQFIDALGLRQEDAACCGQFRRGPVLASQNGSQLTASFLLENSGVVEELSASYSSFDDKFIVKALFKSN